MRILFALLSIVWWISVWGFSDGILQNLNKNTRTILYGLVMLCILSLAGVYPEVMHYL
jgi:bacteriorhodopsin